ncbi:uncharacterized protein LOC130613516 [Hydractinia symbiolongicarpus]|uniref:uncharacterized protein LOC130613516 n=1 Tax=Hydractinia symbiolongicarpus TaxID=13093 RepID=UPI00254E5BD2|nr:uncharacterized protein LOC130613516 [Hydractinia symbiolongicarpus]
MKQKLIINPIYSQTFDEKVVEIKKAMKKVKNNENNYAAVRAQKFEEKVINLEDKKLSLNDWSFIKDIEDVNLLYKCSCNSILKFYDKRFPIQTKSAKIKTLQTPWISKGKRKSYNQGHKYVAKQQKYKLITQKLSPCLPISKFQRNSVHDTKQNIDSGGKIPDVSNSIEDYLTRTENKIGDSDLTFEEFETAFKSTPKKQSNWNRQPLVKCINKSIFPDDLKTAKVIPIFKAGDSTGNRKQHVSYDNDKLSEALNIICGVPQGSILRPLLFIICINDLYKASSKLFNVMFADHTNLFKSGKNVQDLFVEMNLELRKISLWFKKKNIPSTLSKLQIDNTEIKRDKVTKFLGIYIDENLTWKYHIDTICSKISRSIEKLSGKYNTRSKQLKEPIIKTKYEEFCISCRAPHIWNKITPLILED